MIKIDNARAIRYFKKVILKQTIVTFLFSKLYTYIVQLSLMQTGSLFRRIYCL